MIQALLAIMAVVAFVAVRVRRRGRLPARAVIVSPRRSTIVARDRAVYSVQSAELTLAADDLERLWSPTNLENLARTYWRFLSRVTLGLIRVVYGEHERRVVFLARPFTLLRFDAPEYSFGADRGEVRWRIRDGLLVARGGRGSGYLAVDVRREREAEESGRARLRIEVEVANFYPAIAASFSTPVYEATQSSIHVLVTHAFLRSLATLDLAESRVGRLATQEPGAPEAAGSATGTAGSANRASGSANRAAGSANGAPAPTPEPVAGPQP